MVKLPHNAGYTDLNAVSFIGFTSPAMLVHTFISYLFTPVKLKFPIFIFVALSPVVRFPAHEYGV